VSVSLVSRLESQDEETSSAPRILSIHAGHSANCSSIGSVIDYLFVSSVVASSLVAAVTVVLEAARASRESSRAATPTDDAAGDAPDMPSDHD